MKLNIQQPQYLYEAGNQPENEDFIFPIEGKADPNSRLFIVCDGDKGSSKSKTDHGGIASQLLAMTISSQFSNLVKAGDADQDLVEKIVRYANDSLGKYLVKHPDSEGIGASFALVHFGETKVTLAWLGNSRVYHYNKNLKTVSSSDQWEEDMPSPAPDAKLRGTNSDFEVRTRFYLYDDVSAGDYFFLASSGMDQEVHVSSLKSVFTSANDSSPEAVMGEISNLIVSGLASDNYSCYLIPLSTTAEAVVQPGTPPPVTGVDQGEIPAAPIGGLTSDTAGKRIGWIVGGVFGLIVVLLLAVAYLETQDQPFEEMLAEGDEHLQALKDANTTIGFAGSEQEALAARAAYDSAFDLASSEEERRVILTRQSELEALLDANPVVFIELMDLPMEELTQTAAQYIKDGKEFFDAGNYPEALQAFWNAERKLEESPDSEISLPGEQIAESYIRIASTLFVSPDRNCEAINDYYAKAFSYYRPEEEPEWYRAAKENTETCVAVLAAAESQDEAIEGPQEPPEPASASEVIASAIGEPVTRSRSLESSSTENRRVASPTPTEAGPSANARVRGIETPTISEEKMAELKRLLSEGKRQYIEAKDQNSPFLYSTSADKLERSAQALDGPGAYLLAYMYHAGLGVNKDEAKALRYAQISARKKWAAGEYLYGHLLLERQNKRDTITAVSSLRMSANQFYTDAINRLSDLGLQP